MTQTHLYVAPCSLHSDIIVLCSSTAFDTGNINSSDIITTCSTYRMGSTRSNVVYGNAVSETKRMLKKRKAKTA